MLYVVLFFFVALLICNVIQLLAIAVMNMSDRIGGTYSGTVGWVMALRLRRWGIAERVKTYSLTCFLFKYKTQRRRCVVLSLSFESKIFGTSKNGIYRYSLFTQGIPIQNVHIVVELTPHDWILFPLRALRNLGRYEGE